MVDAQDDDRAAGPADHHREIIETGKRAGLQKPRLSVTRACPGGRTGPSLARRRPVAREGTARRAGGPPVGYRDNLSRCPIVLCRGGQVSRLLE